MSAVRLISRNHGNNVSLNKSRSKVTWSPGPSHSWVFSQRPLVAGKSVDVCCSGAGCCVFGLVQIDPTNHNHARSLLSGNFPHFKEINFRSKSCLFRYQLTIKGNKVLATCDERHYTQAVNKGVKVWIAFCIKFGEVAITLLEPGNPSTLVPLAAVYGPNIAISHDNLSVSLYNPCPGSLCLLQEDLKLREAVFLRCRPIDVKPAPSKYQINLILCTAKPNCSEILVDTSLIGVKLTLENEDCDGIVKIAIVEHIVLTDVSNTDGDFDQFFRCVVISASGKETVIKIPGKFSECVWLALELYKTKVKIFTAPLLNNQLNQNNLLEHKDTGSECTVEYVNESIGPLTSDYNVTMSSLPKLNSDKTLASLSPSQTIPKRVYAVDGTEITDNLRNSDCNENNNTSSGVPSNIKTKRKEENIADNKASKAMLNSVSMEQRGCKKGGLNTISGATGAIASIKSSSETRKRFFEHTRKNYTELLRVLQPHLLSDYLFEYGLLSDAERGEIVALRQERAASRQLIDLLCKKNINVPLFRRVLRKAEMVQVEQLFLWPE